MLVVPFVWLGILLTAGTVSSYAETGGTVRTNGVITFYEEELPPTEGSNSKPPVDNEKKPSGKLPSTGELVKRSLGISGVIILAIALILILIKRKRKEGKET